MKALAGIGLTQARSLITRGEPVYDVEMFTNEWYDEGGHKLLAVLSSWEERSIDFSLHEIPAGDDAAAVDPAAARICVELLRNTLDSGEGDLRLIEELDDLRLGGGTRPGPPVD